MDIFSQRQLEAAVSGAKPTGDLDTGGSGKRFEGAFIKALSLLNMDFNINRATGSAWDIHPVGDGWHRLISDKDVNIKVYSARWLFSDRATYNAVRGAVSRYQSKEISKDEASSIAERAIRKTLSAKGLPKAIFLKPKDADIQQAIITAVDSKNRGRLEDLFSSKNFASKKLGPYTVDVKVNWNGADVEDGSSIEKSWQATANITIDGNGQKEFGITGRVERAGGVYTFFFRDRSKVAVKPYHGAITTK